MGLHPILITANFKPFSLKIVYVTNIKRDWTPAQTRKQIQNSARKAREGKGNTTTPKATFAGVMGAGKGAGAQVARSEGSSPVGTAGFNTNKTVPEGNKNKPDFSQRGKGQSYPPGHPSYGFVSNILILIVGLGPCLFSSIWNYQRFGSLLAGLGGQDTVTQPKWTV